MSDRDVVGIVHSNEVGRSGNLGGYGNGLGVPVCLLRYPLVLRKVEKALLLNMIGPVGKRGELHGFSLVRECQLA